MVKISQIDTRLVDSVGVEGIEPSVLRSRTAHVTGTLHPEYVEL